VQPTFHRNQFGVTLAGRSSRTNYSSSWITKGLRQAQGYLNFYSVPDTNDRAGILPVAVVDPLTGVLYPPIRRFRFLS